MKKNINKFNKAMNIPKGNGQNKGKPTKEIKPFKGGKG